MSVLSVTFVAFALVVPVLFVVVDPCQLLKYCRFCKTDCFHCVEGFGRCVTDEGPFPPPNCEKCWLCHFCVVCGAFRAVCGSKILSLALFELALVLAFSMCLLCDLIPVFVLYLVWVVRCYH